MPYKQSDMKPFLKSVAEYLYGKYGDELGDCAMVFPGRRAGLFFRNYLGDLVERPLWMPRMMTISDLMGELSGMQAADTITLNLRLYNVFRSVTGSTEEFDRFYNWGEVMIRDFDEADKYLVDAEKLFRNISALKDIENHFDFMSPEQVELVRQFWGSFNLGSPSEHQKEFLWIWEELYNIYIKYRELLAGEGMAYEGMIFRHVAGLVEEGNLPGTGAGKYFVAGFNALNECEKRLFDYLKKEGRVEFFWDYDEYYTNDGIHQAGLFIRENIRRYPHDGYEGDTGNLSVTPPEIDIVAVPSNTGQAKIMEEAGLDPGAGDDPLQSAIILPDESLLLPVLSSMPDEAGSVNITMGYPLKETSLFGFAMLLADMQLASHTGSNGKLTFPGREVISLLRHPEYPAGEREEAMHLVSTIRKNNMLRVESGFAAKGEMGRLVFRKADGGMELLDYMLEILEYMERLRSPGNWAGDVDGAPENSDVIIPGREFLSSMCSALRRLKDTVAGAGTAIGSGTMVKLLRRVLSSVRIPFYGEPLGGLQVMGVLETRALDFENVLWLSMNEGVFPSVQPAPSFIPYTLRAAYRLPRPEQQEAVYTYYFYRLLHRAKKVTLVYNTRSDGLYTGEVSRYIHQLDYSGLFNVRRRNMVFSLSPPDQRPVLIGKSGDIMERLREIAGTGRSQGYLSANALNSYMDCSMRFYFRYIARLQEPEKMTGEIDMAAFGSLLHRAAFFLYEPLAGKTVTADDIDRMTGKSGMIDDCVERAFRDPGGDKPGFGLPETDGLARIAGGVLASYLRQILERDRRMAPFEIVSLEQKYRNNIIVPGGQGETEVATGGIIDRIDRPQGVTRVADYKTGGDDTIYRTMESLFEREDPKRKKAVFQTLFYSWLYIRQGGGGPVRPVIYQVKKLFSDEEMVIGEKPDRNPARPVNDFREYIGPFEENMRLLLEEIFDEGEPFRQAGDRDICRYCPYRVLCHR